jgi:hypothetical protein
MKTKTPITYTGSNTENLYILGIRNGHEIKIKVKEIGCQGPIKLGEPGLIYGRSFQTFEELNEAKINGLLNIGEIYTVVDKGTIEGYIINDSELIQISGNINSTTEGDENDNNKSSTPNDEDGIVDYNLSELTNGDYMFKNHTEISQVYCDMPNLKSGRQMFYGCPLTDFYGSLYSLDYAWEMFKGAKLNKDSIIAIADGIKDHTKCDNDIEVPTSRTHYIHIGCDPSISEKDKEELAAEFQTKGWTVKFS